jgi:hypothetical protein
VFEELFIVADKLIGVATIILTSRLIPSGNHHELKGCKMTSKAMDIPCMNLYYTAVNVDGYGVWLYIL